MEGYQRIDDNLHLPNLRSQNASSRFPIPVSLAQILSQADTFDVSFVTNFLRSQIESLKNSTSFFIIQKHMLNL